MFLGRRQLHRKLYRLSGVVSSERIVQAMILAQRACNISVGRDEITPWSLRARAVVSVTWLGLDRDVLLLDVILAPSWCPCLLQRQTERRALAYPCVHCKYLLAGSSSIQGSLGRSYLGFGPIILANLPEYFLTSSIAGWLDQYDSSRRAYGC